MRKTIILFDEQGTPTFRIDRENEKFLGVCVSYESDCEDNIFRKTDEFLGLSNTKPLKNNRISDSRVLKIAEILSSFEMFLSIAIIDLKNIEFQRIISLYKDFGNIIRNIERNIKDRPLNQIIHSQILQPEIFRMILRNIEWFKTSTKFSIYIDNWAFPKNDEAFSLEYSSEITTELMNNLTKRHFKDVRIKCDPYILLTKDSKRKRFIDGVTSVISRQFQKSKSIRIQNNITEIISAKGNVHLFNKDITELVMFRLIEIMDDLARNGKE